MPITPLDTDELARRAGPLQWLLFDVDGVLTDGRVWYSADGETLKAFHVRDGLAIRMAQHVGLNLGLFSGRRSPPLERRASDLDFDTWILGSGDKGADMDTFLAEHKVSADAVAFIGDDLIDLPVIRRVGLSFAPSDAVDEVLDEVDYVLSTAGGHGVVREMVELLLRARGEWDAILAHWADR